MRCLWKTSTAFQFLPVGCVSGYDVWAKSLYRNSSQKLPGTYQLFLYCKLGCGLGYSVGGGFILKQFSSADRKPAVISAYSFYSCIISTTTAHIFLHAPFLVSCWLLFFCILIPSDVQTSELLDDNISPSRLGRFNRCSCFSLVCDWNFLQQNYDWAKLMGLPV